MADLTCKIAGVTSPNPFWLASAPPTDKEYNVVRAFKAGWGGVVWKTLGEDPPVVNVSSRYGATHYNGTKMMGFNNIELITDRPLDVNLIEIERVKKAWPDRAMVVSLMVPCDERSWQRILKRVETTGCDAIELNFGCPHGMAERGMGSAVGQVPEYIQDVTSWCKKHTKIPTFVKLTPNITNILLPARAAVNGGADAVSLINTINSITAVNLDVMAPEPVVNGVGAHGGYCGPAVKPIALCMVAEIARDPACKNVPISGIGGISTWRDAAEFISLGAGSVQVCTAAMHHGFKIIEDMVEGLSNWMDDKGYKTLDDFRGLASKNYKNWQDLDMNYDTKALINQDKCISCGICHIACEDTSHQAITINKVSGKNVFKVVNDDCVGCNLCMLACPVDDCITMERVDNGKPYMTWLQDPRNPASGVKKETVANERVATEAQKQKVLIIEDNAANAKLLELFLKEAGFETIHAIDGYTGLQIAKTQQGISAILLDRIMPDIDGLDVLKELKLGQKLWGVPVIMLTAALSTQQIQAAKLTGAYACLPKPYNREKIIVTLQEAIKNRRKT